MLFFMKFNKLNSLLALSILTILIATLSIYAQPSVKPAEIKPATEKTGVPVVLKDETLFLIYDKVGPFTPEDRAKAITERLAKLIKDPLSLLHRVKQPPIFWLGIWLLCQLRLETQKL
jgi:hypothetical protein